MKMSNKRELAGLASNLGGYWGDQEEEVVKKAPKKNNSTKKTTGMKKEGNAAATSYTMEEKTHKEAGFYGGDTMRVFVPQNKLGDEVDKFLYWVFCETEEFNRVCYGTDPPDIENASKDDIDSFFIHLDESYMASLSFFSGGKGTFSHCMANGLKNKDKKGSAIEQMKAFAQWYEYGNHPYVGGRIDDLDWLIKKLEAKKVN